MLAKLTGRTELRNHIYGRGEIVEITDDEYAARPGCFIRVESADEGASPAAGKPAPLTRAQLQAKLDSLGIPYKARDTVEQLQAKLADAVDNHPLTHTDAE